MGNIKKGTGLNWKKHRPRFPIPQETKERVYALSEFNTPKDIAKAVGISANEVRRIINNAPIMMLPESVRDKVQCKKKNKTFSFDKFKYKNPLL